MTFKKALTIVTAVCLSIGLLSVPAGRAGADEEPSANILNDGFETLQGDNVTPQNWTYSLTDPTGLKIPPETAFSVGVDDTTAHSGSHALKIVAPSGTGANWQKIRFTRAFQEITLSQGLQPGVVHELSLWVKTSSSGDRGLWIQSYNAASSEIDSKNLVINGAGGGVWQQGTFTFIPPDATAKIRVSVVAWGSGTYYYDDVSMRAIQTPESTAVTDSRIELQALSGYEYALVPKDAAVPTTFVSNPVFTGLTDDTEYDAYQRIAAVGGQPASATSAKATISTLEEIDNNIPIANPGFEVVNSNGLPVSWGPINSNTVYGIETTKKKSGNHSLKIDSTGGTSASMVVAAAPVSGIIDGAVYNISAYVSTDMSTIGPSGAAGITMYYFAAQPLNSGNYIGAKHVRINYNTNDQFVHVSESFSPPAGTRFIQLFFRNFSTGVAYFDDLSLSLGEPPNTYSIETSHVFHYPDEVSGTASVKLTPFYLTGNAAQEEIEEGTLADFELRDGNNLLYSAYDVTMSDGVSLFTYPVSAMTQKKKAYQLHVTVKDADDDTVLEEYEQNMYVYDRPAMMTASGDFIVDGELFNPVIAYHAAPASYAKVKEAGINVVQIGYGSAPIGNVTQRENTLSALETHDLKGLFSLYIDMKPAGHPDNLANTQALVQQYKDDERIFAWAIMDEPLGAVTIGTPSADERLAWLEASYKAIRDIDPIHPVYVLDYNNLLEGVKYGDVFVADIYALGDDTSSVSTKIAPVTEAVSRVATYELAAIFKQNNRFPTMNTVRNQVYRGFEAGARGTGYYAIDDAIGHDSGDIKTALYDYDAQVWADFVTLNQEEVPLLFDYYVNGADIFNEVRVGDVGRELIWQIWSKDEKMYLMAHNQRTTTEELIIPLMNQDASIQLGDYTALPVGLTSQTVKSGNGSMTLNLAKEEIALFELVVDNDNLITNGGFEAMQGDNVTPQNWTYSLTDPTGLTIPPGTAFSVAVDNTTARTGSHALKIVAPSGTGANWQKIRFTRAVQEITLEQGLQPGVAHALSLWVKTSSSGDRGLWVQSYNAANAEIDTKNFVINGAGSGVWQKGTFTFIPPVDAVKIRVSTVAWGSGTYYYDDVSVRTVLTPETAAISGNSIILKAKPGYEYALVSKGAAAPTLFGSSPIFNGLTEGAEYDAYQRIAAAAGAPASIVSVKLGTATLARPSENIPVLNPGYESIADGRPSSWTPIGTLPSGAAISADVTKFRSGSSSLKISNPTADITQSSNQPWVVQNINSGFLPGGEHELSVFLNADFTTIVNRGAGMKLEFYPGGTGQTISFDQSTNGNWQEVKSNVIVPVGTTSIRIYTRMYANGVVWFDDISLRAFVEPAVTESLINGGFEGYAGDTPANWGKSSNAAFGTNLQMTTASNNVRYGGAALKMTSGGSSIWVNQRNEGYTPGATYTFSAWVKAGTSIPAANTVQVKFEYQNTQGETATPNGSGDITIRPGLNGTEWTRITAKITLPDTATKVNVMLRLTNTGEIYWDQVSLGSDDEV